MDDQAARTQDVVVSLRCKTLLSKATSPTSPWFPGVPRQLFSLSTLGWFTGKVDTVTGAYCGAEDRLLPLVLSPACAERKPKKLSKHEQLTRATPRCRFCRVLCANLLLNHQAKHQRRRQVAGGLLVMSSNVFLVSVDFNQLEEPVGDSLFQTVPHYFCEQDENGN